MIQDPGQQATPSLREEDQQEARPLPLPPSEGPQPARTLAPDKAAVLAAPAVHLEPTGVPAAPAEQLEPVVEARAEHLEPAGSLTTIPQQWQSQQPGHPYPYLPSYIHPAWAHTADHASISPRWAAQVAVPLPLPTEQSGAWPAYAYAHASPGGGPGASFLSRLPSAPSTQQQQQQAYGGTQQHTRQEYSPQQQQAYSTQGRQQAYNMQDQQQAYNTQAYSTQGQQQAYSMQDQQQAYRPQPQPAPLPPPSPPRMNPAGEALLASARAYTSALYEAVSMPPSPQPPYSSSQQQQTYAASQEPPQQQPAYTAAPQLPTYTAAPQQQQAYYTPSHYEAVSMSQSPRPAPQHSSLSSSPRSMSRPTTPSMRPPPNWRQADGTTTTATNPHPQQPSPASEQLHGSPSTPTRLARPPAAAQGGGGDGFGAGREAPVGALLQPVSPISPVQYAGLPALMQQYAPPSLRSSAGMQA